MRARTALLVSASLICSVAEAGQQCHSASVPLTVTNWNQTFTVPRFDPALGTLNAIDVTMNASMLGSMGAESLDSAPTTYTSTMAVQLDVTRPDMSLIATALPSANFVDNFTAFDGTIDFGGTSGVMHTGITAQTSIQSVLASPADLVLFTGPAGNPGSIGLKLIGAGVSYSTGPGGLITQFTTQSGMDVLLCYEYTPLATSFCAGDGTATTCPCGNASVLGAEQGCLNSTGIGARLSWTGNSSVSNDTLVLGCSGVPAATFVLFFQGTAQQNNGNGAVFGDGLRCVAGTIRRLRIKMASGGIATYPQAGDAPISVTGAVPANSVRHYQTWYRNAAAFCTSATFNLSQGLTVHWSP